ncbi:hypothetical protein [Sphingobacterium multivorum]|uniref:hypothetical protein n=1 Tax=Sphingobacterium multivorum TaxID=28454 RepID=UPI00368D49E2
MDKLFRQVSVKDRLPEKDGIVVCISSDGQPFITLYEVGISISSSAAYWLEEVELPTEDEILEYARDEQGLEDYDMEQDVFVDGANYILNTLKGENK